MEYKESEASDSGEFLNKMELDEEQWQHIGHTGDGGDVFYGYINDEPFPTADEEYQAALKKLEEYIEKIADVTDTPTDYMKQAPANPLDIKKLDEYTKQYGGNKPSEEVTTAEPGSYLMEWMEKYDAVYKWKSQPSHVQKMQNQIPQSEPKTYSHQYFVNPMPYEVTTSSEWGKTVYTVGFQNPSMNVEMFQGSEELLQSWIPLDSGTAPVETGTFRIDGGTVSVRVDGEWKPFGMLVSFDKDPYPQKVWYTVEPYEYSGFGYVSGNGNVQYGTHSSSGSMALIRDLQKSMPDLKEIVNCPQCDYRIDVWNMVQHLNDKHRLTRETIADWLETLDVDLTFPTPENPPKEPGEE